MDQNEKLQWIGVGICVSFLVLALVVCFGGPICR